MIFIKTHQFHHQKTSHDTMKFTYPQPIGVSQGLVILNAAISALAHGGRWQQACHQRISW